MSKRFKDALAISDGAINPAGIARALVSACDECLAEHASQKDDPAVMLIVSQLAYLCGVWGGVTPWQNGNYDFEHARRQCQEKAALDTTAA